MKKFSVGLLVCAGMVFLVPAGFASPKKAQELRVGLIHEPLHLDPGIPTDISSINLVNQIYEGLVRFKPGSTEVEPALATLWRISPDMHSYTFELRRDVFFHDGTPLNADAVIYSLMRQHDPKHEAYSFSEWGYWNSMGMHTLIKSMEKVDTHTVKFNLTRPEASFLSTLAMHFTKIASPTAIKKHKKNYDKNPSGTGPFRFQQRSPGKEVILTRNEKYWGEAASLSRVSFVPLKSVSDLIEGYLNGKIHLFSFSKQTDLESLKKRDSKARIEVFSPLGTWYLAFHSEKPPFNDLRVRQALNMAFDKPQAVKDAYGEMAIPAIHPIPPSMWGYNHNVKDWPHDKKKARELLQAAGVKPGLKVELLVSERSETGQSFAKQIVKDFAEVGVDVQVKKAPSKEYLDALSAGEFQMGLANWIGDNGDPDNFLHQLLSSENATSPASNVGRYRNTAVDEILTKAKVIPWQENRAVLYREAQAIIKEDAPWIPIAHFLGAYALNPRIEGFIPSPTYVMDLGKVSFKDTP